MELWIHVHRFHWFYLHDGILDYLDWSWLDDRPNCCMGLALQVHSTVGEGKGCSFAVLLGFQCNRFA